MNVSSTMWLFWALPGIANVTLGVCPTGDGEARKQMDSCLKNFPTLSHFAGGIKNPSVIRQYCASTAATEVQCAENVIHACRQSSAQFRQEMEKTLNMNVIRDTVNLICSNINTLVNSQHCIAQQEPMTASCLATLYRTYTDKLNFLKENSKSRGDAWLNNELYKSLCEYTDDLIPCLQPFRMSCGSEVGDIMDQLFEGSRPPVCARRNPPQTTLTPTTVFSFNNTLELAEFRGKSSVADSKKPKHSGMIVYEPSAAALVFVVLVSLFLM